MPAAMSAACPPSEGPPARLMWDWMHGSLHCWLAYLSAGQLPGQAGQNLLEGQAAPGIRQSARDL